MAPTLDSVLASYENLLQKRFGVKALLVNERCDALLKDKTFLRDLGTVRKLPSGQREKALSEILRLRGMSGLFLPWSLWLLSKRKENRALRPRFGTWLGFYLVENPEEVELLELTTEEKREIIETFKHLAGVQIPRQHISTKYRSAYRELQQLLKKSKNKMRRAQGVEDEDMYESDDDLDWKIAAKKESKRLERIRKQKYRLRKRVHHLAGSELKK
ncbi:MAG TPA: hypothetical protein VG102_03515 [Candidatus Paceibacterota bacterium]|jgi:hypothetical protein|nr:hypothetical protein [Candidatus Paceibacterota bacterium]